MAKPRTAVERWGQYLAVRAVAGVVTSFSAEADLVAARALGRLACRLDGRHRRRATRALRQAFPDGPEARIAALARRSFEHFGQLMVEVCHLPRLLHRDSWGRRLRLHNMERTLALLNAGRPVILITGHVGNWELVGYFLALAGYRVSAVARPLDNPLINDWVLGIRQRQGLEIITKLNATDRMTAVLDAGGALGLIADQDAGPRGLFVPFFGRLASTFKSIALLAVSRRVPVVCGYGRRLGPDCRYELGVNDLIAPEDWADQADPLYYVTARYTRAIENMARAFPDQYLWMHRRWKSRPAFETAGRPMPPGLRRQLEGLPWMDEPALRRLQEGSAAGAPT